jgi:hypothetical protein
MEHKEGEIVAAEVKETKETKEGAEPAASLPMSSQVAGKHLTSNHVRTF